MLTRQVILLGPIEGGDLNARAVLPAKLGFLVVGTRIAISVSVLYQPSLVSWSQTYEEVITERFYPY